MREAKLFLSMVTVSKSKGEYIDPVASRVPVRMFADSWLRSKQYRDSVEHSEGIVNCADAACRKMYKNAAKLRSRGASGAPGSRECSD